jgi:hypothetical protein
MKFSIRDLVTVIVALTLGWVDRRRLADENKRLGYEFSLNRDFFGAARTGSAVDPRLVLPTSSVPPRIRPNRFSECYT